MICTLDHPLAIIKSILPLRVFRLYIFCDFGYIDLVFDEILDSP